MADTQINVHEAMGTRLPSVAQVDIVVGDTLTFTSADDDAALHFSPALLGIIAPNHEPFALLQAGQQLQYTFTSVSSGAHEIILQDPASPAPQDFASGPAQTHVLLRAGGTVDAAPDPDPEPVNLQASLEEVKFEVGPRQIISNPIQT